MSKQHYLTTFTPAFYVVAANDFIFHIKWLDLCKMQNCRQY
jgi:hypothetical protein